MIAGNLLLKITAAETITANLVVTASPPLGNCARRRDKSRALRNLSAASRFADARHFAGADRTALMKTRDTADAIAVIDLDGNGVRCAVAVDGRVRFVGSHDECARRAELLRPRGDRPRQDVMLVRAVG